MQEKYTRQALPPKKYRELLGSALCVFNSNNSFIIENILRRDSSRTNNWYDLIDKTSGKLLPLIRSLLIAESTDDISILFEELVLNRNRIIHSFQITDIDGEQRLATKDSDNRQYVITEEYLLEFIKKNEKLSSLLYELRVKVTSI